MGKGPLQQTFYSASLSYCRQDRPEGPSHAYYNAPSVAGVAVAPVARVDRHPGEIGESISARSWTSPRSKGARRALLRSRQVLLPEG